MDDIRQALGAFVVYANEGHIDVAASPFARISDESKQDKTFVPLLPLNDRASYIS